MQLLAPSALLQSPREMSEDQRDCRPRSPLRCQLLADAAIALDRAEDALQPVDSLIADHLDDSHKAFEQYFHEGGALRKDSDEE